MKTVNLMVLVLVGQGFLGLTTPSLAVAESRTWTDASGKHKTTADLADFQGGVAYLKKGDGKITAVPLAKLSQADRAFVKFEIPAVKVIEGKVVGIADGDTVTVLQGKKPFKIRLEGIDAPEGHQNYGNKARQSLAAKVFGKTVRVEWRERDKYKRTLGHVFLDGKWINKEMVADGWAWHFREFSKSEVLSDAESDARTAKLGLWADKDPTPPWKFRHNVATPLPAIVQGLAPATQPTEPARVAEADRPEEKEQAKEETVYVTKTGSKYHRAGCRHLKSSIRMLLSEAASRYSPCSVCNPPQPNANIASNSQPQQESVLRIAPPQQSVPKNVDRNPYNETVTGHTATGIPTYTGPRGGRYHYSPSGKKVYEKKKK